MPPPLPHWYVSVGPTSLHCVCWPHIPSLCLLAPHLITVSVGPTSHHCVCCLLAPHPITVSVGPTSHQCVCCLLAPHPVTVAVVCWPHIPSVGATDRIFCNAHSIRSLLNNWPPYRFSVQMAVRHLTSGIAPQVVKMWHHNC